MMALTGFSNSPGQILLNTDFPRSLHQQSSFGLKKRDNFSFKFERFEFSIPDQCVLCSGEAGCIVVVKTTSISLSFFVIRQQGFLLDKI